MLKIWGDNSTPRKNIWVSKKNLEKEKQKKIFLSVSPRHDGRKDQGEKDTI